MDKGCESFFRDTDLIELDDGKVLVWLFVLKSKII
jgi:hypothetical protein